MSKKVINLLVAIRFGMKTLTAVQIKKLFEPMIQADDDVMIGQVYFAYSKQELVQVLATAPIDVVLCGEELSGEAIGAGSINTWRKEHPSVRIILLMDDSKKFGKKFVSLVQRGYYDMIFNSEFSSHELIRLMEKSRSVRELIEHYNLQQNEDVMNIPAALEALKELASTDTEDGVLFEEVSNDMDVLPVEEVDTQELPPNLEEFLNGEEPGNPVEDVFFDDDAEVTENSEHADSDETVATENVEIGESKEPEPLVDEEGLLSLLNGTDSFSETSADEWDEHEEDDVASVENVDEFAAAIEQLVDEVDVVVEEAKNEDDFFFDDDDEEEELLGIVEEEDVMPQSQTTYSNFDSAEYKNKKDFVPSTYSGDGYILNVVGPKSLIWESSDKEHFPVVNGLAGTRCYLLLPYISDPDRNVATDVGAMLPALRDTFKPTVVPVKGTVIESFNSTTLLIEVEMSITSILHYLKGSEVVLVRRP